MTDHVSCPTCRGEGKVWTEALKTQKEEHDMEILFAKIQGEKIGVAFACAAMGILIFLGVVLSVFK